MSYQGHYGERVRSGWGDGPELAEYALGDIVYIPPDCLAVKQGRVARPGVYRVTACFSISEGPEFYYRASPMQPTGRGDRWRTDWDTTSGRLHALRDINYTHGWVRLHSAKEPPA